MQVFGGLLLLYRAKYIGLFFASCYVLYFISRYFLINLVDVGLSNLHKIIFGFKSVDFVISSNVLLRRIIRILMENATKTVGKEKFRPKK